MKNLSFSTVDIAGSAMSYLDVGAGEAVVLGHSYLWDARMWQPQIAELAKTRRIIVPELWGHGSSGHLPNGTASLKDIAKHHLQLLDRLGLDRFALVGLSVGGMWAAELALMAPERVTGLVLMDTYLGPEPEQTRNQYFAMLSAVEQAGRVSDFIVQAMLPMFFAPSTLATRPDLATDFLESLQRSDPQMIVETLVPIGRLIFTRRDAMPDLSSLKLPAIVMTGHYDQSRPVAEGRAMAAVLGCDFVELAEAGHIANLETPDEVTRQIAAFLDRYRH